LSAYQQGNRVADAACHGDRLTAERLCRLPPESVDQFLHAAGHHRQARQHCGAQPTLDGAQATRRFLQQHFGRRVCLIIGPQSAETQGRLSQTLRGRERGGDGTGLTEGRLGTAVVAGLVLRVTERQQKVAASFVIAGAIETVDRGTEIDRGGIPRESRQWLPPPRGRCTSTPAP